MTAHHSLMLKPKLQHRSYNLSSVHLSVMTLPQLLQNLLLQLWGISLTLLQFLHLYIWYPKIGVRHFNILLTFSITTALISPVYQAKYDAQYKRNSSHNVIFPVIYSTSIFLVSFQCFLSSDLIRLLRHDSH